jgi:hypothetical protein
MVCVGCGEESMAGVLTGVSTEGHTSPMTTTAVQTKSDELGVEVKVGDRVIVSGWAGGRARAVGDRGTVESATPTRLRVRFDDGVQNVAPHMLTVLRRDGRPGFEGYLV